TLYAASEGLGAAPSPLHLSAVTGQALQPPHRPGPATATQQGMIALHAGRYAQPTLRWLYFASGLGGTAMIATGLILWTVKRRAKLPDPTRPHLGFRLVERLNVAVIAGAPAGVAGYFLANRLLPLDLAQRAEREIAGLFLVWGALVIWTAVRPLRRAWIEALAAAAFLYALVPLVSALTTARGLVPSLVAGDWTFAGFDLVMLATAALLAVASWQVVIGSPGAVRRSRSVEAAA
ncbi:MAG: PepSY-associated TM helix domain-containing protein, partial [Phenylobacterium sp.]